MSSSVSRQARPPLRDIKMPSVVAANMIWLRSQLGVVAKASAARSPKPKLLSSQVLPELRVTRTPAPSVAAKAVPSDWKLGEATTTVTVALSSSGTSPASQLRP